MYRIENRVALNGACVNGKQKIYKVNCIWTKTYVYETKKLLNKSHVLIY